MPRDFEARKGERPLFDALLAARDEYGGGKEILEDQDRKPLTYTGLVRAAFVLGRKIADRSTKGERLGLLLPSSAGVVVTFFGLHAFGRVPVMLNFTAGLKNVAAACRTAGVRQVLTSKRFVEQAKLEELVEGLKADVEIVWLDDVRKQIGTADKLYGLAAGVAPRLFRTEVKPSDPGVILFTSGSFGAPRGVVLTQANLCSNVLQIAAHIELDPDWVFFNPLPVFHVFGLTGGVLLPLLRGMKAFEYPSPLHAKQIPPLVRDTKAAVMLATDTFLNQYARAASSPEDLSGLKFIVCGAEKVRDETHHLFATTFGGVPVLEGYGATECSPVIAVNHPDRNRRSCVGQVLPGVETRLEPVDGITEGGRLFVRGPNVMAGYLNPDGGALETLPGGWHDTGDIVTIDEEDYVQIVGRAKRFAKIGGEMVSLTAVEGMAEAVWPEARHAVVSVPDQRKGERLVLVTDRTDADVAYLADWARRHGAPELAVPKKIVKVAEVPVLGTGKTDYVTIQQLVEDTDARAA
jgi:acyl-[acyl-carrier-protein]-phospholipid O-acyltransferase/long-chain-fatty-acid--[acyl-carrier-protein] ligase